MLVDASFGEYVNPGVAVRSVGGGRGEGVSACRSVGQGVGSERVDYIGGEGRDRDFGYRERRAGGGEGL